MKPNFSGEYLLDRASSALSSNAAAMESAVLLIEDDEPPFRCSATFSSASDTVEFRFERFTDGHKTTAGAQEQSRCYWDDDALISEDRMEWGDEVMVMIWRYELMNETRRLRAREQIRGAGRDQENVWELDRK